MAAYNADGPQIQTSKLSLRTDKQPVMLFQVSKVDYEHYCIQGRRRGWKVVGSKL